MVKFVLSNLEDDKKDEPTLESELSKAGMHIFIDRWMEDRMRNIYEEQDKFMSETEVDVLELTDTKKKLMKMVNRRRRYLMSHAPFAKAKESRGIAEAMDAALDLLDICVSSIYSDASDSDVQSCLLEHLEQIDKFVGRTFDTQTNSINKSFTMSGGIPPGMWQGGAAGASDFAGSRNAPANKSVPSKIQQ